MKVRGMKNLKNLDRSRTSRTPSILLKERRRFSQGFLLDRHARITASVKY
jgi:hypothetical protein